MITEELLLELGFYREDVSKEESGGDEDFYYFTFNPIQGISLITNSNDEVEKDGWTVEFFDSDLKINSAVTLRKLIGVLTEILKANGFVGGNS